MRLLCTLFPINHMCRCVCVCVLAYGQESVRLACLCDDDPPSRRPFRRAQVWLHWRCSAKGRLKETDSAGKRKKKPHLFNNLNRNNIQGKK